MIQHPLLERNIPESKKQRIFRVFHKILQDYSISDKLYAILLILEGIQMLFYVIHTSYKGLWPVSYLSTTQQVLGYIATPNLWRLVGSIGVMVACCLMIVMMGIPIMLISIAVLSDSCQGNDRNIILTKILGYYGLLIKTVLTIPIISLTTTFIGGTDNNIDNEFFAGIAVLSILTLLLYIANLFIFSLFFIDNSPFSVLPFSSSLKNNGLTKIILKCIMGLYGSIIQTTSLQNLGFSIFLFLAFIFLLYKICSLPPFLRFPLYNIHDQIIVILCWISFTACLQIITSPEEEAGIYFSMIGSILINFCWLGVRKKKAQSIIYSNYKNLTQVKDIIYYNYLMISYVMKLQQCPLYLMRLEGILSEHIRVCFKSEENCICRVTKRNIRQINSDGDRSLLQKQKRQWFTYIKSDLLYAYDKYRNEAQFSLLIAYIEKVIMLNNFKTLKYLQEQNQQKSGLRVQFLNYHQKRIVEEKMYESDRIMNEKKAVDVNKFYYFEMDFGKMEKLILESTISHMNFWKNLSQKGREKEKIIKQGHEIFKKVKKIKHLYESLMDANQNNIHTLILYSNYMKYITNTPDVLAKNSQTIKNIKKNMLKSPKISADNEKQKYGDNSITGIIIISGQRKNIGIIKHCSSKVTDILHYPTHQLVGQNINTIMPQFLGNMHNDVLCNYLEQAQSKFDFIERLAPMINKETFLILSKTLTKPLPSLLNGLELVGLFQPIKQFHIKHQKQIPKYVLYRSDTGKIESMSENCYSEYGYKITKVNHVSESSSDLNFNEFFINIRDSEIKASENGYTSTIKQKQNKDASHSIVIYLRHQIFYFGVKLKLLYFFSSGHPQLTTLNPVKSDNVQGEKQDQKKQIYTIEKSQQGISMENSKNSMNMNIGEEKPIKVKIIVLLVILLVCVLSVLSIVQLYLNLSYLDNCKGYLQNMKISSDSMKNMIDISYYGRLTQLASLYPSTLVDFNYYKQNISTITSQLQSNQFQLVNQEIQLSQNGFTFTLKPLTWKVNEDATIVSQSTNININVFDYVTSASNFNSVTQSDLTFDPVLLSNVSASNEYYRNLFRIRYTSLFQTSHAKEEYHILLQQHYLGIIQKHIDDSIWMMIGMISFILLITIILIPIIFSLLTSIFQILKLFVYLSGAQIEKERENCFLFIKIFFGNFYTVMLEEKQKANINSVKSMKERLLYNTKLFSSMQVTAQFNQLQQHDFLLQKTDNGKMEEKVHQQIVCEEQIKQKIEKVEDEQSYEDEDSDDNKKSQKLKILLVILVLALLLSVYFIANYVFMNNKHVINRQISQIFVTVQETISLIKTSKAYAMETAIDNTKFRDYQLLSALSSEFIDRIYQNQRRINKAIFNCEKQQLAQIVTQYIQYNSNNICEHAFSSSSTKNFKTSSYSAQQCKTIASGILKQGLRTSIVGYSQILTTISNANNAQDMINLPEFQYSIVLEKYIVSALSYLTYEVHSQYIHKIKQQNNMLIISCIIFIIALVLVLTVSLVRNIRSLCKKIMGTCQIIKLIPQRVFQNNARLSNEYQNLIKILMK